MPVRRGEMWWADLEKPQGHEQALETLDPARALPLSWGHE